MLSDWFTTINICNNILWWNTSQLRFLFSSVQSLSHVWLFVTPWTAAHQAFQYINSRSLLKLMSVELVMPSNHLFPISSCLQSFPASGLFPNESVLLIRWPNYPSFSFSTSPSNEYSELISFRIDWLISLLSKWLSIVFSETTVQKHQFFSAQLSLWSNSLIHTLLLENIYFCKQCQNSLLTGENEIFLPLSLMLISLLVQN